MKTPSGAGTWMNLTLTEIQKGEARLKMKIRPEMCNPYGMIHGGMMSLLIDESIGWAIISLESQANYTSLNLMVGESHDTELAELLADDVSPDPVDTVSENETVQEVRLLLSQLPERESTVLRLRYGIPADRCRTLDEIGAQLGVTRERIRQIQVRAERHLREMLKRRSSFTLFAA